MKKIFKFITLFLALLLIIPLGSGCGLSSRLTKVRLSEATHSIFYAPQYVAISEGFFKEQGLEIELLNGQGADKVMTAVLSKQCDIGFAGPEACIYVYSQGKENYPKVFAQLTQKDGAFLVARTSSGDFKWSDVKGKTIIGGRPGGVPEMTLEYVLKKNGIIPGKDVTVNTSIQFANMAGAFKGGMGDYVTLFEPVATAIEKENAGKIVASIGQESGLIAYTAYFATQDYMKNNEDIIQKFTNAIYKGQLWVKNHSPEEIAKSIQSFFPDSDEQTLASVIKRYKDIDAWCGSPTMTPEALTLLQDVIETAGQLDKRVEFDSIFYSRFARTAVNTVK